MWYMTDSYINKHTDELFTLLRDLAQIPAPTGHEEKRAEFCKNWLESAGAVGVYTDEKKNVVFPYQCEGKSGITALFAHTDTVFPDMEPMEYSDDGEVIRCPGICDDTANLAVLMMSAKFIIESRVNAPSGLLFVFNSSEEGLGNLAGTKQIFKDFEGRIARFVTFDGTMGGIVDKCVGSHRYELTVKTKGGHSYGAFGNKSAVLELSKIINDIYAITPPKNTGSKTTYNVGLISGGTSVNTIPESASMLCEYRSDDLQSLNIMKKRFEEIFEKARTEGVDVSVTLVGERPCMGKVDQDEHELLISICEKTIYETVGTKPLRKSGSTDANVPLSMGIPAVCIGACIGGGAHTRAEWLEKKSLTMGLGIGIKIALALSGRKGI